MIREISPKPGGAQTSSSNVRETQESIQSPKDADLLACPTRRGTDHRDDVHDFRLESTEHYSGTCSRGTLLRAHGDAHKQSKISYLTIQPIKNEKKGNTCDLSFVLGDDGNALPRSYQGSQLAARTVQITKKQVKNDPDHREEYWESMLSAALPTQLEVKPRVAMTASEDHINDSSSSNQNSAASHSQTGSHSCSAKDFAIAAARAAKNNNRSFS